MSTFRCPVCAKENPEQAKFCLYCGTALEAGAERVCPQCGAHLPAHARFCFACGVSLDASSSVVGMKHGSLALPEAVERLMPRQYVELLQAAQRRIGANALRRTASTRAVRLLGAAHEMLDRAGVPRVRHATQTTLYDQLVNQAQAALGHPVFREALAEGRLLTVEQAQSEACAIADCIAPLTDEEEKGCEE